MNDDKLNQLLQSWSVKPGLPPSFEREVWRRIEAQEDRRSAAPQWLIVFFTWLTRPLPAIATCTLALAAGLAAGGMIRNTDGESRAAAYAYSIDPLSRPSNP